MKFEKVSRKQYSEDSKHDFKYLGYVATISCSRYMDEQTYDDIKLPKRATRKSAGYDFFAPYDFSLAPGDTIRISTGIRVLLDDDRFLMCAPRSGHGFKARIQLDNTIGIIDADYSDAKNEGHIMLKLTNDSNTGKSISVKKGEAFAQGIIIKYGVVEDDSSDEVRVGGFGSTDKEVG